MRKNERVGWENEEVILLTYVLKSTGQDETGLTRLMFKVTGLGQNHCHTPFVGRGNHLIVPYASTRLNGRSRPGISRRNQPVCKGKERIRANRGTLQVQSRFPRFPYCDSRTIHPRHLACTYSKGTRSSPE